MNTDDIRFFTKACSKLSEKEIQDSATLFSNHYGIYSASSPDKAGKQIKLGHKFYANLRANQKLHVSFAYLQGELLGHAYYLIVDFEGLKASWVIQLVVHTEYRGLSIGKKLLHSVWGFSNDLAWGLATSNPLTIKTLESATLRKVLPKEIKKNYQLIKKISAEIDFIQPDTIEITDNRSIANTDFYVDHSQIPELLRIYSDPWVLGELPEGHEWIAFTFQDQEFKPLSKSEIDNLIDFSEKILNEAYSRMNIKGHNWSRHSVDEVSYILKYLDELKKDSAIADFGCGIGRHLEILSKFGYNDLFGIDFSQTHIDNCKEIYPEINSDFLVGDCRYIQLNKKFDAILCLYDVIGSFPEEVENLKIIENIYTHLNTGGIAVISVMNMELTEALAINITDIYKHPEELFKLKASSTMQESGDIFKPEYYLIDSTTKIVYRKEIFKDDAHISAQYIIRDKRYTGLEICGLLEKVGFEILQLAYVQAGRFDKALSATDKKAKEILIFAKK